MEIRQEERSLRYNIHKSWQSFAKCKQLSSRRVIKLMQKRTDAPFTTKKMRIFIHGNSVLNTNRDKVYLL